ncbi:unnamed protein product [Litomosoides sigmodontis]|uniref:Uncharacterized protein n=1 Tax=Litomosoides sigmodontis TaxID=42156 RepID=A0A3P6VD07_LITSI|nr:unnamed protein product [Litomosoides sigmodontis]
MATHDAPSLPRNTTSLGVTVQQQSSSASSDRPQTHKLYTHTYPPHVPPIKSINLVFRMLYVPLRVKFKAVVL